MDSKVEQIDTALAEIGVPVQRGRPGTWQVDIPCVERRSITVGLAADERTLRLQAFLMRAPDRRREQVHARLLGKNLDLRATGPWRFAIDDLGDIHLVADLPLSVDPPVDVDGLLGALSALVDATWTGLLRTGFVVPDSAQDNGRPAPER